jgi:DNA repair protein RadD
VLAKYVAGLSFAYKAAPIMRRWYQQEAVHSVFDYFVKNAGNPVIAMPTGTGKSHVQAGIMQDALTLWPTQRFIAFTHVKELLTQDYEKLIDAWPLAPAGLYSAGLRRRDTALPIIFAGIASAVNNLDAFGHRDLGFVDEADLVSPEAETLYQRAFAHFRSINPYFKICGLTATPFRMGQGYITDGGIFTDICYDLTTIEAFARLIAEGWIVPLIPKRTATELDTSSVGMAHGEFVATQLQAAVDKRDVTYSALRELCEAGYNRRSWLVFGSGIEHTEHIAEQLRAFGVSCVALHSKLKESERDERIIAFKSGEVRCLSTNNMFTTGHDHPPIDLIGMLRPTMSARLWVQMLGRGMRPYDGKSNCLVLDFAGNTRRLGPINDPVIPRKKGEPTGEVPVKICDMCGVYNHASARICCNCGAVFDIRTKIVSKASTEALLRSDLPIVEYFNVDRVHYSRHMKLNKPPTIKVAYYCGLRMFNELVCLEHEGFAQHRAHEWWRQRHQSEPPATTDQALAHISTLRTPRQIRVWVNKPYPEVLSYVY